MVSFGLSRRVGSSGTVLIDGRLSHNTERLAIWGCFGAGLNYCGLQVTTVVDGFLDPFGTAWHLDRPIFFDNMLRDVAEMVGVRLLRNTRVTCAEQTKCGRWIVTIRSNDRQAMCDADGVIDARGRQHRDLTGRPRPASDDRLVDTVFVFAAPLRAPQSDWTLVES